MRIDRAVQNRLRIADRRNLHFCLVVAAVVLLGAVNHASAIITGFLPGDACFGSSLSAERLEQIDSNDPVVLPYRTGEGWLAGCGYSGYWNLAIRDMPDEMKANLRKLYREMRKRDPQLIEIRTDRQGNERRLERNPYTLLIYNKDYDLDLGIGLKLNENWMNLLHHKVEKRYPGAYWPYVTDHRAVARDWELSPQVPGLAVNETDARPWWGPAIDEPLTVQADRIQILVIPEKLYTSFALATSYSQDTDKWIEIEAEMKEGGPLDVREPHFFRVTTEGVSRCHYDAINGFVAQPWPPTPTQEKIAQLEEVIESLERGSADDFSFEAMETLRQLKEFNAKRFDLKDNLDALADEIRTYVETLRQQSGDEATTDEKQ